MQPKICFVFLFFFFQDYFAQNLSFYFGNLHAHTAFSDGNKDSLTSGIARPDASFNYAKLSADFDFLGISEHNHYSSFHNPGFKKPLYQVGLNMADAANQDGTFLALYGMEYGVSSQYNGHVLIYGVNQLIGWETNAPDVIGNNYDVFNAKTDYDALFRKVKNVPKAFCYLAHPDFSDFSTDGTYNTSIANAPYNATYDSVIIGMPLRSGLANSSLSNYSDYSQGNYFNYYKKMLYQGYHLGIGYDHDNHYSNFGRSNGGRLVVMMPSLSRANLYLAMKQRHFYGSDDSNAQVTFDINGNYMGSIVSGSVYPTISLQHNDPDGETADTIKIWRGYKNSGGLWAEIINITLQTNAHQFTDYTLQTGIEYYYFCELRQSDGQWIVTSPVWYTASAPLGLNQIKNDKACLVFLNQVSKKLSLSLSEWSNYNLKLSTLYGQLLFETNFSGTDYSMPVNSLASGIYLLSVENSETFVTKKILIE